MRKPYKIADFLWKTNNFLVELRVPEQKKRLPAPESAD
jgi:hypothetical protein